MGRNRSGVQAEEKLGFYSPRRAEALSHLKGSEERFTFVKSFLINGLKQGRLHLSSAVG